MIKIVECLNVNKLSLNLKKTQYMVFRSCRRIVDSDLNITINGFNLVQVESTKCLGTVIDSKLCWLNHANFVRGTISQGVGILCKAKTLFHPETLFLGYRKKLCELSHLPPIKHIHVFYLKN